MYFVGGSSWFPNRDALEYFAADILPILRVNGTHERVTWVGECSSADRESQIVQERRDHIVVKIVPSAEFTHSQQDNLVAALQERVGEGITINVQIVDDIPRERSGKYRWVISKVRHKVQTEWLHIDESEASLTVWHLRGVEGCATSRGLWPQKVLVLG